MPSTMGCALSCQLHLATVVVAAALVAAPLPKVALKRCMCSCVSPGRLSQLCVHVQTLLGMPGNRQDAHPKKCTQLTESSISVSIRCKEIHLRTVAMVTEVAAHYPPLAV